MKKSSGTLYYYIPGTSLILQESDLAGNTRYRYVFFNGKRIVRRNSSTGEILYYFSDHLGSSNVVTNATGTTIKEESDFYPFGGERVITDTVSDQNYKFTGKERDTESNLDYFGARYYSSNLGRFITPDWAAAPTAVPYAEFGNPQSLNLYSYLKNNPIKATDPDGHGDPVTDLLLNPGFQQAVGEGVNNALDDLAEFSKAALTDPTTNSVVAYSMLMETMTPAMAGSTSESLEAESLGAEVSVAGGRSAVVEGAAARGSTITERRAAGLAFQDGVATEKAATHTDVVQDLHVKTQSGTRTVLDVAGRKSSGAADLTEAKSTATARLTKNQATAHPEIAQTGATVVGKGRPGWPGGTRIPPTKVQVVRPKKPETP